MTFYFSGVAAYCIFLTCRMFQDKECSKTDLNSWTVIVFASLLWMVVVPISMIEIQTKAKKQDEYNIQDTQIPVNDY